MLTIWQALCAALCGCTWAGVPTIWQACAQRCAGARERVCLPCGRRVHSFARVRVSCHLAGVCAQCCAGARERVRFPFGRRVRSAVRVRVSGCAYLPFGRRVRSAVRVHVSGCAYYLAGMCAVLMCTWQCFS